MLSQLHQSFPTSTLISPPACAQMLAAMAWVLYSSKTQQAPGTLSRPDHDSSQTPKLVMQLLLAVCWAISKCKLLLSGLQHFTVITDHNPLIPILNNHRLDEIENPHLQRLKTRIMAYNFTAQWLKGANNTAPDALSRHPVCNPQPVDALAERDIHNNPEMSFTELRAIRDTHSGDSESLRLQELRKQAEQDEVYQLLRTFILNGFPKHRKQLPDSCRRYWNIHQQLTLDDNLIVYGCRLLIPSKMRHQVLSNLHEAH